MCSLEGKWKNVRDENFSEYLKALGVGTVKRVVIDKVHPDVEIKVDGDNWVIKTISTFSTQENSFTIGQTFETDYKAVITGKMRCMPTFDGNKLTVEATPIDADVDATTTAREIVGDEMVQTMTCKGVVAKRYYQRK